MVLNDMTSCTAFVRSISIAIATIGAIRVVRVNQGIDIPGVFMLVEHPILMHREWAGGFV